MNLISIFFLLFDAGL